MTGTVLYIKKGKRYVPWGNLEDRSYFQDVMKVGTFQLVHCVESGHYRYRHNVTPDSAAFVAAAFVAVVAVVVLPFTFPVRLPTKDVAVIIPAAKPPKAFLITAKLALLSEDPFSPIVKFPLLSNVPPVKTPDVFKTFDFFCNTNRITNNTSPSRIAS